MLHGSRPTETLSDFVPVLSMLCDHLPQPVVLLFSPLPFIYFQQIRIQDFAPALGDLRGGP